MYRTIGTLAFASVFFLKPLHCFRNQKAEKESDEKYVNTGHNFANQKVCSLFAKSDDSNSKRYILMSVAHALVLVSNSLGLLSINHLILNSGLLSINHLGLISRLVVNDGSLDHGLVVNNGGNLLLSVSDGVVLVLLSEGRGVVSHIIVVDSARVSSVPRRVVSMGSVENVGIGFSLSLGVSLGKMTDSLGTEKTLVEHIEGVLVSHGELVGHGLVLVELGLQELSGGRGNEVVAHAMVGSRSKSVSLAENLGVRLGGGESQKGGQNLKKNPINSVEF